MTSLPEKRLAQSIIDQNPNPKRIKAESQKAIAEKGGLKLASWNVGGINACLKKGFLEKVKILEADIILLQETKLQTSSEFISKSLYPFQYQSVSKSKKGYSGSALLSKIKPIQVEYSIGKDSLDDEGRYIIAEFEDFFLVAAYIPNAGSKLERLDVKRKHHKEVLVPFLQKLLEKKSLIFAGDLNVAHKEIDLARPKTNHK
jgi:exodeoxyribonuclease III